MHVLDGGGVRCRLWFDAGSSVSYVSKEEIEVVFPVLDLAMAMKRSKDSTCQTLGGNYVQLCLLELTVTEVSRSRQWSCFHLTRSLLYLIDRQLVPPHPLGEAFNMQSKQRLQIELIYM